jgi:YVTN family beta-propeller protein
LRRWGSRVIPAAVPWPIYSLSLLAALALVASAAIGFEIYRLDSAPLWYFVVAALAACASVVLQRRHGLELVAGTTAFGVLGAAMVTGWSTNALFVGGAGVLSSQPAVAGLALAGHAAWIGAGAAALWRLRKELTFDVRRLRGRLAWTAVGLGGLAAAAQLGITLYLTYNATLRFRSGVPLEVAALQIAAAELALAGPLIAMLMRRGLTFLGGWVLAGFAILIGVYGGLSTFAHRTLALIVLLAVWSLLAGVVIIGRRRAEAADPENPATGRARWWIVVIATVLPVALGGAVVVVDPRGPATPIVLSLVVGPNNDVLYGIDSANGTAVKINTHSQLQEGEALEVGEAPAGAVLAPDGDRLYVASTRSNSVSVIDVANWKVVGQPIPVGPEPIELALSPETKRLFALSSKAATITVVDTERLTTVGGPVSSGATPSSLVVGQDGKRLYVAGRESSTVAVFDAVTMRQARSPYKITGQPIDLSITRDDYLYVLSQDSYSVVNTNVESPRPTPVPLPGRSKDAVLTDDGSRYVVLGAPPKGEPLKDLITVIDTKERDVIGTAEGEGGLSLRVEVSHDNQRIYAVGYNFEHNILIVDATIPKAVGAIDLGR